MRAAFRVCPWERDPPSVVRPGITSLLLEARRLKVTTGPPQQEVIKHSHGILRRAGSRNGNAVSRQEERSPSPGGRSTSQDGLCFFPTLPRLSRFSRETSPPGDKPGDHPSKQLLGLGSRHGAKSSYKFVPHANICSHKRNPHEGVSPNICTAPPIPNSCWLIQRPTNGGRHQIPNTPRGVTGNTD